MPPAPEVAQVYRPGSPLTAANSSAAVRKREEAGTTSTIGPPPTRAICVKSSTGS